MLSNLKEIWKFIDKKKKLNFFIIIFLTVLTSLMEVVSIGSVIPVLAIMLSPVGGINLSFLKEIGELNVKMGVMSNINFVLIIFMTAILVTCILRLSLLSLNTKFAYDVGVDIGNSIYGGYLSIQYEYQIETKSSLIIDVLTNKMLTVITSILMTINLVSSMLLLCIFAVVLLYVDYISTVIVLGVCGVMYFAITRLTKIRLDKYSNIISELSTRQVKIAQETSFGMKEIIISGAQMVFFEVYARCNNLLRHAQARNHFYSLSPRYTVEAASVILMVALAYYLISILKNPDAFVILAAIAFGAQRLLPLMQQAYVSWATIKGNQNAFDDVFQLFENLKCDSIGLNKVMDSNQIINFNINIEFKSVSFKYMNSTNNILQDINWNISRGEFIGITGITGSGKSTLIDLFLGLLQPTEGKILVDQNELSTDKRLNWSKKIAYVTQSTYILDATIEENIAFGIPREKIINKKVKDAAIIACIDDFIGGLEYGYKSKVGEGGSRLSGGQKQRIGIARALYKGAQILVLDEATSALDTETEKKVIDHILANRKDLTLISISHRLSTLKQANKIFNIKDGILIKI